MHFVHVRGDPATEKQWGSVIGVIFDKTIDGAKDNTFIEQWVDAVEFSASVTPVEKQYFFVRDFLETLDYTSFYRYEGSLTTPPCTEGVTWNVLTTIQPISERQLTKLQSVIGKKTDTINGNARVVQPWNGRSVYYVYDVFADEENAYIAASITLIVLLVLTIILVAVYVACKCFFSVLCCCCKCLAGKNDD